MSSPSPSPAHPRSRGENRPSRKHGRPHAGSSPLTRGKHSGRLASLGSRGLIPAHAGKTGSAARNCAARRAHPRSRGENTSQPSACSSAAAAHPRSRGENEGWEPGGGAIRGSSPLTRGKLRFGTAFVSNAAAHPRSRGENSCRACRSSRSGGSSPLTRGKHSLTCAFIKRIGQILESLELCASSGNYSLMDAYATDAPQDQARNTGLAPPSSRGAS